MPLTRLKRRLRSIGVPLLTPATRWLVRYAPLNSVRRGAWFLIAEPYLARQPRRFAARTVFGSRIAGETRDVIQRQLYWFGVWEPSLTKWIARRLDPGDGFLDVGANIGYFSLLASRLVGPTGSVLAVEASPTVAEELVGNMRRNNAANVAVVVAAAAGGAGRVPVYRAHPENLGQTSTYEQSGFELEGNVDGVALADIVDAPLLQSLRVVKIDVQGAEVEALRGLLPALTRVRPDCEIVIEVHPQLLAARGSSVEDVVGPLRALGYSAYTLPISYTDDVYFERKPPTRADRLSGAVGDERDLIFSRIDAPHLD